MGLIDCNGDLYCHDPADSAHDRRRRFYLVGHRQLRGSHEQTTLVNKKETGKPREAIFGIPGVPVFQFDS